MFIVEMSTMRMKKDVIVVSAIKSESVPEGRWLSLNTINV